VVEVEHQFYVDNWVTSFRTSDNNRQWSNRRCRNTKTKKKADLSWASGAPFGRTVLLSLPGQPVAAVDVDFDLSWPRSGKIVPDP
jgi:hypothetical protein